MSTSVAGGDWRTRLERARRRAEEVERPSPERVEEVLRRRAATLAEPLHDPTADPKRELLAFTVGGAAYAVDAARVAEVFALPDITPVPGAPQALSGVVLHRGRILSIVELTALLGDGPPAGGGGLAIELTAGLAALAVRADELTGAVALVDDAPGSPAVRGDAVVERVAGGTTAVLDVDALAADSRIVVDIAVDTGGSP